MILLGISHVSAFGRSAVGFKNLGNAVVVLLVGVCCAGSATSVSQNKQILNQLLHIFTAITSANVEVDISARV